MFVSSSALFPLERYVTAGGEKEEDKICWMSTPCSYIHPSIRFPFFIQLRKWVFSYPVETAGLGCSRNVHSSLHRAQEVRANDFLSGCLHIDGVLISAKARVSPASCMKSICYRTKLVTRKVVGLESTMYTQREGHCSASAGYITA